MTAHVPRDAVVVGIDGSQQGWQALSWASERAEVLGLALHVMHAEGAIESLYDLTPDPNPIDNVCEQALGMLAHHHPGLTVTWSQPPQSPTLALAGASLQAAEIVLGTRGTGSVRGAVLGSVTTQVTASAHCPVIVVRGALSEAQRGGPVVVGVDGRPSSTAAVDFAFLDAQRRGVPLIAVLAWQLDRWKFAGGIPRPAGDAHAAQEHHRRILDETLAAPAARHPDVPVTSHLECGPTAGSLAEHAADASLLVVGTRGHRELTGLLLGSVSQAMMRRAPCPVAVVSHPRVEPVAISGESRHSSA